MEKNDHQKDIDYPLHKSQCLVNNLYLLLVYYLLLIPHLHLELPHPPAPQIPCPSHSDPQYNTFV